MNHVDLTGRLFIAFQKGDVDSLRAVCAPDMQACQNMGPSMDLETHVRFCRMMHQVVADFRYEDVRRQSTELRTSVLRICRKCWQAGKGLPKVGVRVLFAKYDDFTSLIKRAP